MLRSLQTFLRAYGRDGRGVVSVMAAGAMLLVLAVAMIVIDTGSMLYARRDLQAATDAAALGAVRQIATAQAAAEAILVMNGYSSGDAPNVVPGEYTANPSLDRFARFDPGADEADFNAVRVTKFDTAPTYFARIFGFGNLTEISATSTAAYIKTVSFSAGTRVADLNEGLANQILGGLLGTNLSLSLIDYNGLASANVDALQFLDALAAEVGLDSGSHTYGNLLATNVTIGDLVAAAVEVLTGENYEGNPAVAKLALEAALLPVANNSVQLGDLLNATPFASRTIGSITTSAGNDLAFNLFDLVSGAALLTGAGQTVGFNATVNLAPLASITGTIKVGEPMAHMTVGKVGDFVRTSQVEIELVARIDTGIAVLVDAQIEVPVYITAAEGMAAVSSIPCVQSGSMTTLEGTTGPVAARYGTVGDATPTIATIELALPLLGTVPVMNLQARGSSAVGAGGPTNVAFTLANIENGDAKSTASDVSLLGDLGSSLTIDEVALLGVPVPDLEDIVSTLTFAVGGGLTALDPVVNSLLTTLGVRLGSMDMIVHGVRCNTPTLVL
ncbi:MAG: hypothetical protein KF769_02835 [Parvibaculum sp.]|nr:hypothetical protein [Parvibaculum sp.]